MGQNNFESNNSHASMPLNWQMHPHDANVLVNRLTHQQLQRNHIKIPMKKLSKQAALLFTRMGNIYPHVCRLYYYHYTGSEPPGTLDPDKENRNFYAYTDRMLKLKTQSWNRENMVSALEGFKELADIYGPFKITEHMIGQNQHGQIRVWINNNPGQNHPGSVCNNEEQSIALLAGLLAHKNKSLANSIIGCCSYREASQKLENFDYERCLSFNEVGYRPSENGNRKYKKQMKEIKQSNYRNVFGAVNRLNIEEQGCSTPPIKAYDKNQQNTIGNDYIKLLKPQSNFSTFSKPRNKVQSYITMEASPYQRIEHKQINQAKPSEKYKIDLAKNATMIDYRLLDKKQKIKMQPPFNGYLQNKAFVRDKAEPSKCNPVQPDTSDKFHSTFPKAHALKDNSPHLYGPEILIQETYSVAANKSKINKEFNEFTSINNKSGIQNASDLFPFNKISATRSKLGSHYCHNDSIQKQKNDKIPIPLFIQQKSKQGRYQQHKYLLFNKTPHPVSQMGGYPNDSNYLEVNKWKRGPSNLNKSTLDAFTPVQKNFIQRECNSKHKEHLYTANGEDPSAVKNHEEIVRNRMSEGPINSYKPRIFSNSYKPDTNKSYQAKAYPSEMSANKKMDYLLTPPSLLYRGSKGQDFSIPKMQNRTKTTEFWAKPKERNYIDIIPQSLQETKKTIVQAEESINCDISEQFPTTQSIQIPKRSKRQSQTAYNEPKKSSHLKEQIQQQFVCLFGQSKQKGSQKEKRVAHSSSQQKQIHSQNLTESQEVLKKKIKMKKMAFAELKKQALMVLTGN